MEQKERTLHRVDLALSKVETTRINLSSHYNGLEEIFNKEYCLTYFESLRKIITIIDLVKRDLVDIKSTIISNPFYFQYHIADNFLFCLIDVVENCYNHYTDLHSRIKKLNREYIFRFYSEFIIFKEIKNLDNELKDYSVKFGTIIRQLKFLTKQGN